MLECKHASVDPNKVSRYASKIYDLQQILPSPPQLHQEAAKNWTDLYRTRFSAVRHSQ